MIVRTLDVLTLFCIWFARITTLIDLFIGDTVSDARGGERFAVPALDGLVRLDMIVLLNSFGRCVWGSGSSISVSSSLY